ncbi:NAD(P)-dependent oxidoreductase [Corynebacterium poyangense]
MSRSCGTVGSMKIAFLGTGRMGTELARHLLPNHEVTVWNRTPSRTRTLTDLGAQAADSPQAAVAEATIIISSLFGPDTVRDVIISPQLIPAGVTWVDTTTVSPADAEEFAAAVDSYVHAPVVGTLGPARKGMLGVYVGTSDPARRNQVLEIVSPWADPQRLKGVDSAAKAAAAKLLANLALAISAEGLREALDLGSSFHLTDSEILTMLDSTGLAFISIMKAPFVLGERSTEGGDFSTNAIAKDARLMVQSSKHELPALEAALRSLSEQQKAGRGEDDFSAMICHRRG